jgi:hypothetical protein
LIGRTGRQGKNGSVLIFLVESEKEVEEGKNVVSTK